MKRYLLMAALALALVPTLALATDVPGDGGAGVGCSPKRLASVRIQVENGVQLTLRKPRPHTEVKYAGWFELHANRHQLAIESHTDRRVEFHARCRRGAHA